MKFKGFWKGFWELQQHSCAWLKDYWFAYTILFVCCITICFIPYVIEELQYRKKLKSYEEDLDFLNN